MTEKQIRKQRYHMTGELFFVKILGYSFSICRTKKALFSKRNGLQGKNILGYNFCLQKIK